MANNTTFILPQWLIPKEPGMNCRSHQTILAMFATYNIISIVLSVILASPFFVNLSQKVLPWNWECWKGGGSSDEAPGCGQVISLVGSALGSIGINLAAPLLSGNSIVKNHPNANRWVIIEQWSTRPRASVFIFVSNLIADRLAGEGQTISNDTQGFVRAAVSSLVSEIVLGLFGIKFLLNQASVPLQSFDASLPCNDTSREPGAIPANCPAMQQGAIGLSIVLISNTALVVLSLICIPCAVWEDKDRGGRRSRGLTCWNVVGCDFFVILIMMLAVYGLSWFVWVNFLHQTPEELYCVESSVLVDVIYCLLPVVLGLWRLAWVIVIKE